MNRNQKIAIGCGAAGCLGLICLVIVGAVVFLVMRSTPGTSRRTGTANINRSSSSEDSNANSTDSDENGASSSSMSDDDKHKLFQAGAQTQDTDLVQRVWRKLGLTKSDGSPNDAYAEFVKNHVVWVFSNSDFIKSIDTPEKARAYVEAHIND